MAIGSALAKLKAFAFMGNPNLKKVGTVVDYSEDQIAELRKCINDPKYFIRTYCKIVSLDRGLVPFKLFPYQERFIDAMHENRKVISMQPRQSGKTQVVAAYILWYSIFNESKTVAILANKAAVSKEILSRYQAMYETIPIWMQQGIKIWNKGDIELENGSKVFTGATSKSGIRGKSANFLYIDEMAIIPNNIAEEFFAATYPVISAGKTTKIVITSTPLGYNHFWKFWVEAEKGVNGFIPIRIDYWEHPERDEAWADEQRKNLGEIKFNQEVLMHFLGSSYTLLSGQCLSNLSPQAPVFQNENLDVYEEPVRGNSYIITVDTSRGLGGDYSAFSVIDVTQMPYKLVAKYRDNKISPLLYPDIIYRVANDYNEAYVLVEINDNGQQIADILHNEFEYDNLFRVETDGKTGQKITHGFGSKSTLGIKTTKQVKSVGCSVLKTLMENQKLLVPDADTIAELSTFIERRGSYSADEGYHDDMVMTLVLFAWVSRQPLFMEMSNVDMRKELFERQQKLIEEQLTPFGMIDDGQPEEVIAEVEDGDLWVSDMDPDTYFRKMKEDWLR